MKQRDVIIIEDDVDIRETLQQLLEMEGYRVYSAENGKEGIRMVRTLTDPFLILLDLYMPVMTGSEFLTEFRKTEPQLVPVTPIVILSAAPPDGDVVRSVRPYVSDFVKKPVDLEKFLQIVKRYASLVVPNHV